MQTDTRQVTPKLARSLGYAGLLPQAAALVALLVPHPEWKFTALALGFAYAALILSFLGGMWWGLAAQARTRAPGWVWFAAVLPSLIALLSALPWAVGDRWPGPSMGLLGTCLLGSLGIDYRLKVAGLCPAWWLRLRVPLSIGLGLMTLPSAILLEEGDGCSIAAGRRPPAWPTRQRRACCEPYAD